MYARRLTKEELMKSGITHVTEDARVFMGENEMIPSINNQGYFMHSIYEIDENGKKIKIPNSKSAYNYVYKTRSIGLHRLMWAWFNGEVPDGMVIDHINNKRDTLEDYMLNNLACITPSDNINKDLKNKLTIRMPKYITEEKIFTKLAHYTKLYEQAKKDKDAKAAHKYRTYVAQWKSKLRQYSADPDKYKKPENPTWHNEKYHEDAAKKRELKLAVSEAHRFYTEARDRLGKDDEVTYEFRCMWKLAIAEYQGFCAESRNARLQIS